MNTHSKCSYERNVHSAQDDAKSSILKPNMQQSQGRAAELQVNAPR